MTTKGYVISYIYDIPNVNGEVVNDMPRDYRQHEVPSIDDDEAINAQVLRERADLPSGSYLEWVK